MRVTFWLSSLAMATLYQILGLKEDATHEQIASAYRRLAKNITLV